MFEGKLPRKIFFFSFENHKWKTNSSLLIFYITFLWMKFTFRISTFKHTCFCCKDICAEHFSAHRTLLTGQKLFFLFWKQKKKETGKQQILPSQNFCRPHPDSFLPKTCFQSAENRGKNNKSQPNTDSWSYFKIASCMKQEKENLSVPASHLFSL